MSTFQTVATALHILKPGRYSQFFMPKFLPCTWVWSLIRVMEHEVKLLHLHSRHVFTAPYHLRAVRHHFTSHFLLRHRFLNFPSLFPPLAAAHFDSIQHKKYQTNIKQKAAIRLPPRCSSAAPILKREKKILTQRGGCVSAKTLCDSRAWAPTPVFP